MNKLSIGFLGVVLVVSGCAAQPTEEEGRGEGAGVAIAPVEGTVTPQQRNEGSYGCQDIWDGVLWEANWQNCQRLSAPKGGGAKLDDGITLGCYFAAEDKFLSACKGLPAN